MKSTIDKAVDALRCEGYYEHLAGKGQSDQIAEALDILTTASSQEGNDTIAGLIQGIEEFDRDCAEAHETDTEEVWILLNHIRDTLQRHAPAPSSSVQLTTRERDTILAALRLWQAGPGNIYTDNELHAIANEHGPQLSPAEIDLLCEALNP